VVGLEAEAAQAALQAAEAEIRRIEAKYSRFRADSLIGRINVSAGLGEALTVDAETAALLQLGAQLHQLSEGRFDLTSGVLQQAWDFRAARLPEPAALQAALDRVGWSRVFWDGERIALPEAGMAIDLGALGKEYAADRAAGLLRACGAAGGFVNLAGDIALIGPDELGRPWRLGIQHPRQAEGLVAELDLSGGALCTSGDYERGFELDGQRYHHLLDARNGWPVCHWQSVSVVAPSCAAAGAVSTLAMLLGEDALPMLEAQGVWYLAIGPRGRTYP
jgi:thiamine biosynthesis lipoprotein